MNPNHIDVTSLRIFLAVARSGSISGGASEVNLSVAAVSKRMAELESIAGTPLLYRGATGVELTPAGMTLQRHAYDIQTALERLAGEMDDYAAGLTGHVRIAANPSAILQGLPERLGKFAADYPGVKIELRELLSEQVIESLRDRKADVGVFAGNISYDGLRVSPFGSDILRLVVPVGHPLSRQVSVKLRDALEYDFISQMESVTLNSVLLMTAAEEGMPLKLRSLMRGYDGVCSMVAAGLGLAVVPESAALRYMHFLRLQLISLNDAWACRPLLVGVREGRGIATVVKTLLDYISS